MIPGPDEVSGHCKWATPRLARPQLRLSALLTNTSRAVAFRASIDWRRAAVILLAATPACLLGAWGYTTLNGREIMILIGLMMLASVPLRRLALRHGFKLKDRPLAAASAFWGVIVGGHYRRRHHPVVDTALPGSWGPGRSRSRC
jgi:hypothetical protein